jgi:hypothetical protein
VRGIILVRQNSGVHVRVQGLDPAAQDLRKTGHIADGTDFKARLDEFLAGAPGGNKLHPMALQKAGKVLKA